MDVLNKQLSALDDKKLDRDSIIQSNEIIGIGREETLKQFKAIDNEVSQSVEDFFYDWLSGERTVENDPLFVNL